VIYNLCFILPLVVVFVAVYCGATSGRLTAFLRRHLCLAKTATAAFFLVLAALMWVR